MRIHLSIILRTLGLFLMLFGTTWCLPILTALVYQEWNDLSVFLVLGSLMGFGGYLLYQMNQKQHSPHLLRIRDGFMITAVLWGALPLVGALPFYFLVDIEGFGFVDALFEATSGFTTTGATIFSEPSKLARSLLLYRSMLQWLGGMGIVVLAVAVLPMLGVGGMRMFATEIAGPLKDEKMAPHIRDTAKILGGIYLILTVLCIVSYQLAGMGNFDAIIYGFSTASTGGFAPHDESMAYFNSFAIESVALIFMILGTLNFGLHLVAWRSKSLRPYFSNAETKFFFGVLFLGSSLVSFILLDVRALFEASSWGARFESIWGSFFVATSSITSTGYTRESIVHWPSSVAFFLVILSTIGGCSGSTCAGMKSIRILSIFRQIRLEFRKLLHPNSFFISQYEQKIGSANFLLSIWSFLGIYAICYMFFTTALIFTGLEPFDAFSGTATFLNNMGIGLEIFSQGFDGASGIQKILFTMAMLLGRLEIFTIIIIFTKTFWRYNG